MRALLHAAVAESDGHHFCSQAERQPAAPASRRPHWNEGRSTLTRALSFCFCPSKRKSGRPGSATAVPTHRRRPSSAAAGHLCSRQVSGAPTLPLGTRTQGAGHQGSCDTGVRESDAAHPREPISSSTKHRKPRRGARRPELRVTDANRIRSRRPSPRRKARSAKPLLSASQSHALQPLHLEGGLSSPGSARAAHLTDRTEAFGAWDIAFVVTVRPWARDRPGVGAVLL